MEREIKPVACLIQPVDSSDFAANPITWFEKQPSVGDEVWLLAHADDGVLWGQLRDGQLVTCDKAFPQVSPRLRAVTLQQARLFGQNAEVRIWRDRDTFRACRLEDQASDQVEAFDETHMLWGTRAEERSGGFTLVTDGRQGLRHAVPLQVPDVAFGAGRGSRRPLRLILRHYLTYDEDGQARIALSRLVALRIEGGQDESQA